MSSATNTLRTPRERAEVVAHQGFDGQQFVLKLRAPECARHAAPGGLLELTFDAPPDARYQCFIMRADADQGTVELLYQVEDTVTEQLSTQQKGDRLWTSVTTDRPFVPHPQRPRALLLGEGSGMAPAIFLAEALLNSAAAAWKPLVLLGSEAPFPFRARPSAILTFGIPDGVIACMPLLEEWGIASRLATRQGFPGCYDGSVIELATEWLQSLDEITLAEVEVFASGAETMLREATQVARRFGIPAQVVQASRK